MAYLYAGMGVVMLTGIMAIMEMGLSLTGQSMLPIPEDGYARSREKSMEFNMMNSLNSMPPGFRGMDICNELIQVYSMVPVRKYLPKTGDLSWDDGCVMDYGSHQILLAPTPVKGLGPYLMVSCTDYDKGLSILMICPFEQV